MRVVKGIFVTRDRLFLFPVKCEMAIFSSWIVISIVTVNRDFPKRSLIFSVNREMLVIFFVNFERAVLFSVKRDLYPQPPHPSTTTTTLLYRKK